MIDLTPILDRLNRATPGPWHYYPCGEKSNDCVLGAAFGDDGPPPPGRVELHPYNYDTNDFDMYKFDFDPVIARCFDHANYYDFCFMAHARTDVEMLCNEVERLRNHLRERNEEERR